jgi:predicted phosphatase
MAKWDLKLEIEDPDWEKLQQVKAFLHEETDQGAVLHLIRQFKTEKQDPAWLRAVDTERLFDVTEGTQPGPTPTKVPLLDSLTGSLRSKPGISIKPRGGFGGRGGGESGGSPGGLGPV